MLLSRIPPLTRIIALQRSAEEKGERELAREGKERKRKEEEREKAMARMEEAQARTEKEMMDMMKEVLAIKEILTNLTLTK